MANEAWRTPLVGPPRRSIMRWMGFAARIVAGGFCATAGRSVRQTRRVREGVVDEDGVWHPNVTAMRWSEWAKSATTDTVPDIYKGETLPDGTIADRPWWYHPGSDYPLRDWPPDHAEPPDGITFTAHLDSGRPGA